MRNVMRAEHVSVLCASSRGLMRIASGAGELELAQLQLARKRIEESLKGLPPRERQAIADALIEEAIELVMRSIAR
jgi:hypothetical protein